MQNILLVLLRFLGRLILWRHKPIIIGVTGTVGKTTITTHITRFLRSYYGDKMVGSSEYHYNGEFGLPLTIISAKTAGKNIWKWFGIIGIAFWRCIRPYPKYLVLEYGIDHPGEMDYLLSIAQPDIVVLSRIAPNHLEHFSSFDAYKEEKLKIIHDNALIIGHDKLQEMISSVSQTNWYSYGANISSDVFVSNIRESIAGVSGTIHFQNSEYIITLPSFGGFQLENILPLFPIAQKLQIPLNFIVEIASLFTPEPGRSMILDGLSGSIIIDGSYNGGYESICRGIDSLIPFFDTHRIILLLGDMRELGEQSEDLHKNLATYIHNIFFQKKESVVIFFVGPLTMGLVAPILQQSFHVSSFLSSRQAGKQIRNILLKDPQPTLIYVKGSQNTIFLEEGIKEFLLRSNDEINLCRQTEEWKRRKDVFFRTVE